MSNLQSENHETSTIQCPECGGSEIKQLNSNHYQCQTCQADLLIAEDEQSDSTANIQINMQTFSHDVTFEEMMNHEPTDPVARQYEHEFLAFIDSIADKDRVSFNRSTYKSINSKFSVGYLIFCLAFSVLLVAAASLWHVGSISKMVEIVTASNVVSSDKNTTTSTDE